MHLSVVPVFFIDKLSDIKFVQVCLYGLVFAPMVENRKFLAGLARAQHDQAWTPLHCLVQPNTSVRFSWYIKQKNAQQTGRAFFCLSLVVFDIVPVEDGEGDQESGGDGEDGHQARPQVGGPSQPAPHNAQVSSLKGKSANVFFSTF